MKAVLRGFELIFGLKVNFNKSCFYGINVDEEFLQAGSNFLCCKVGVLPFSYLGLPIGANPKRLSTWKPVIDVMKKRLNRWKGRFLSLGGRIVLLKSVLSSIPLYFLSFFRLPRKVLKILVGIQRSFLWGGGDNKRGIAWVKWSNVCKPKSCGGLGVKDLDLFNISLLGKWKWHLLVDTKTCWYDILLSRYGVQRNVPGEQAWNPRNSSTWWRDVCEIETGNLVPVNWSLNGVGKKVGNGAKTLFWQEKWFGSNCLKEVFPSLFSVAQDKLATICNMGRWEGLVWTWVWRWRRALFAWEEEVLQMFSDTMVGAVICNDLDDEWVWKIGPDKKYSVKSTYDHLVSQTILVGHPPEFSALFNFFWTSCAPSKVLAFSWQLFHDRVPTRINLLKRNILNDILSCSCVLCGQAQESSAHLFQNCSFSSRVWNWLYRWIDFDLVVPPDIASHYMLHLDLFKGRKVRRFRSLFWQATIWTIWLQRNAIIFNNEPLVFENFTESIKNKSWHWFSAASDLSGYSFSNWCLCSSSCIM